MIALLNGNIGQNVNELDRQIAKSQAKKTVLLLALDHPERPLHNNAAELAVQQRVRKRNVSFGPHSEAGQEAWNAWPTCASKLPPASRRPPPSPGN